MSPRQQTSRNEAIFKRLPSGLWLLNGELVTITTLCKRYIVRTKIIEHGLEVSAFSKKHVQKPSETSKKIEKGTPTEIKATSF
jgi:hypothetical protein